MKYPVRTVASLLLFTVMAGCGESQSPDVQTQSIMSATAAEAPVHIGLDPTDHRIIDFVEWLKLYGVTLEYTMRNEISGDWKLIAPGNTNEYDVVFSIGSFPSNASEQQMSEAVQSTNLAYLLNPRAHLAMSHAGFRGMHVDRKFSEDELPTLDGVPVTRAIEQLFKIYKAG